MGTRVRDPGGRELGEVTEVILDTTFKSVLYLIVAFTRGPDRPELVLAVPWRAMEFRPAYSCFVLDVDQERLDATRGFRLIV